jgi:hypothetical protein
MPTILSRPSLGAFRRHRLWARVSLKPSLEGRPRCKPGLVDIVVIADTRQLVISLHTVVNNIIYWSFNVLQV